MREYIATRFNGFQLDKVDENETQIIFNISNTVHTAICTNCGLESKYIHQDFLREVYDMDYNEKTVIIRFIQRRFKCKNKFCSQGFFIETPSFIDGKRPYSNYIVKEIMRNKEKSNRTIALNLKEIHKVPIEKDSVRRIINDHIDDNEYNNIKILKLDKNTLEKNIDEQIDKINVVTYTTADYILEENEKKYSIIDNITKSFKDLNEYKTTYPYELFIMAGLTSRLKRLVATSSMPFSFTNISAIQKIGYNFLKTRVDGTYFSSGAFRDYLLDTKQDRLQKCFNDYSFNILESNNIRPIVHILDATKVKVNMYNSNYEEATCITDNDGTKIKGYKLSSLYGIYEDQLINESNLVTTLSTHDLKAGKELIANYQGFKKNDILIIDRGYTSYEWFYELKEKGIHVITPAKKDSEALKEALSLCGVRINDNIKKGLKERSSNENELNKVVWLKHPNKNRNQQKYCLIKDITLYSEPTDNKKCRGLKVNCVVIKFPKDKVDGDLEENRTSYYEDKDNYYACIYTTDLSLDGKQILELYEKRMKIEEQFKQMKSNFDLCKLTSTKYIFIVFQLLTTVASLSLVQLFTLLEVGKQYKNEHLQTIIMKMDCIKKYNKTDLIVASKEVFANYKLSEAMEIAFNRSDLVQQAFVRCLRADGN